MHTSKNLNQCKPMQKSVKSIYYWNQYPIFEMNYFASCKFMTQILTDGFSLKSNW